MNQCRGALQIAAGSVAACGRAGIVSQHSSALSHHCEHRTICPALLPASGGSRFLSRQDVPASAGPPLRGAHLVGTLYPRALKDLHASNAIHQLGPRMSDRRELPHPAIHRCPTTIGVALARPTNGPCGTENSTSRDKYSIHLANAAHAGSRTRVTSMGGLYDTVTLRAPMRPPLQNRRGFTGDCTKCKNAETMAVLIS
jgi:hypothetical protein